MNDLILPFHLDLRCCYDERKSASLPPDSAAVLVQIPLPLDTRRSAPRLERLRETLHLSVLLHTP